MENNENLEYSGTEESGAVQPETGSPATEGSPVTQPVAASDNAGKMKKTFNRYGIALVLFAVVSSVLQIVGNVVIAPLLGINPMESSWYQFINILVPLHIIGVFLLFLVTKKMEKKAPEKNPLKIGQFLLYILLMAGAAGAGAVIGFIVNAVLTLPFGVSAMDNNELVGLMLGSNTFVRILVVGITGPIAEELVFRKFLIDRVCKYGELVAILTSGLLFGLFHGNFSQFFFATLLGGLFAYVYIRTGQIWYSIALHMIMNLTTSIITMHFVSKLFSLDGNMMAEYQQVSVDYLASGGNDPVVAQKLEEIAAKMVPIVLPMELWMGFLSQVALAGLVLWIIFLAKKKLVIKKTEEQVKGGMKYAWGNVGIILFVVFCIVLFINTYASMILG